MGEIKSCPKCQGNVFLEWDYGDDRWYEHCLLCSYRHYLPCLGESEKQEQVVSNKAKTGRKKTKQRRH